MFEAFAGTAIRVKKEKPEIARQVLIELAIAALYVRLPCILSRRGTMISSSEQGGQRPLGSFVGRERELSELRAYLADATSGHAQIFKREPLFARAE